MSDCISPLGYHFLATWIPPNLSVHPVRGHRFAATPLARSGPPLEARRGPRRPTFFWTLFSWHSRRTTGGHHGIRNARKYRFAGFETLNSVLAERLGSLRTRVNKTGIPPSRCQRTSLAPRGHAGTLNLTDQSGFRIFISNAQRYLQLEHAHRFIQLPIV